MGAADRTLESADTTIVRHVRPHEAIFHLQFLFSKALRGKGQGWYHCWTTDQEDPRM